MKINDNNIRVQHTAKSSFFLVGLLLFLGIGARTAGPLLSTTTKVTTSNVGLRAERLNSQNCNLAKCNRASFLMFNILITVQ